MSSFVLHPDAAIDLAEIAEYIATDSLPSAERILDEIEDAIQKLVSFPYLGHSRFELTSRPIRFHPVRDYLIAYAPDETPLLVLAVIHGHRHPRLLATLLRNRE